VGVVALTGVVAVAGVVRGWEGPVEGVEGMVALLLALRLTLSSCSKLQGNNACQSGSESVAMICTGTKRRYGLLYKLLLCYGKCSSVYTVAECNSTTARLCTAHDLTCVESPECVIWGVACIVCHVQGIIWLLPSEDYKGAIAAIAEALADYPVDCQAITNVCQLFRQLGTAKCFLQNDDMCQCHHELMQDVVTSRIWQPCV